MKFVKLMAFSMLTYLLPFSANAQIVTVNYAGQMTDVGSLLTGSGVAVGDFMSGSFSYDTDPAGAGLISFSNTFSNGFIATKSGAGSLTVLDNQQNGSATLPADSFLVNSASTSNQNWNGLADPSMQFGLRKENVLGQLWADILPPDTSDWSLISLADINAPDWRILDFGVSGTSHFSNDQLRWDVTSFSVSAVPVPAAVWLFGSGLLGLLGMRKKTSNVSA